MILAALLLQATQPATVPSVAAIGRQQLPAKGCAAYLWSASDRQLVAMASADPATLRLALDGRPAADLPRVAADGDGALGLSATTQYRSGGVTATLDLTVATNADLRDGASVPQATLRVEQPGRDVLVVPLAGLIGCRT